MKKNKLFGNIFDNYTMKKKGKDEREREGEREVERKGKKKQ